eukprot:9203374-Alexandrium_andersonii.AAC.1
MPDRRAATECIVPGGAGQGNLILADAVQEAWELVAPSLRRRKAPSALLGAVAACGACSAHTAATNGRLGIATWSTISSAAPL